MVIQDRMFLYLKGGILRDHLPGDAVAAYQFVGGVTAYQDYDG